MTNKKIVESVFRNYNLHREIIKNITNSRFHAVDDLEQYIYERLLALDNDKLNLMYDKGILINYIVKYYIQGQRDTLRSYYNTRLKIKDYERINCEIYDQQDEDRKDRESREDALLIKFFSHSGGTGTDRENYIAITFLGLKFGIEVVDDIIYYQKPLTMIQIANEFVDNKINHKKIKTKTYLVKNYIKMGKDLLKEALK